MKCYECKYEHSDCKGDKTDACKYFAKRNAVNYNEVIRMLQQENEALILQNALENELNDVFRKEIARLKDENERLRSIAGVRGDTE